MLLAGERFDAEQALAAGLVDQVHPYESLIEVALALAEQIGRRSWRALELTKLALRQNRPATSAFDMVAQALAFESDDKRARMQAFLNRSTKS
jgi:enoyl-CoA hydratase